MREFAGRVQRRSPPERSPNSLGGARYGVEVARQPGLGDGAIKRYLGERPGNDLTHSGELPDIDPGLASHRLEHESGVFEDDVAGGARRIGAAAEPAQRGVE